MSDERTPEEAVEQEEETAQVDEDDSAEASDAATETVTEE